MFNQGLKCAVKDVCSVYLGFRCCQAWGKHLAGGRIWCVDNDSVYHCCLILISLRLGAYQRKDKDRTVQAKNTTYQKPKSAFITQASDREMSTNNMDFFRCFFASQ